MRLLRSMAFVAAALACSLITSMPASAAVPIDPGVSVTASVKEHPAPLAIVDADQVAIVAERDVDIVHPRKARSSTGSAFASVALSQSSTAHLVDLRRRR